jgi:hypothetical protein
MIRWLELDAAGNAALDSLYGVLLEKRPRGWSIVRGKNEVILRPPKRAIGKVSLTLVEERYAAAYFSQRQGIWSAREYFTAGADAAEPILTWAQAQLMKDSVS